MARNQDGRVFARTMPEIVADAMAILREDASEYAFIGLAGGASAGIAVLVLGLIGGPIADRLRRTTVALDRRRHARRVIGGGGHRRQPPPAGRGPRLRRRVGRRGVAIMRPWLPLAVALGAASYGAAALARHMGPVPPDAAVLAFAAIGATYALPRSLCCTALFEYDLSVREAVTASSAVVRMMTRAVAAAWCIVLAPAILVMALGAISGIDIVTGAVVAVLFVGAMPAGAALMSLLFREAATASHRA